MLALLDTGVDSRQADPSRRVEIRLRGLLLLGVGNLVCPAEFKVGEDARVMVYSVTEGEEKPLKYPLMFRSADLVLVNKEDLLEHLDFDLEQFLGHLDAVNPGIERILTSARTGQGVEELCSWLERRGGPSH